MPDSTIREEVRELADAQCITEGVAVRELLHRTEDELLKYHLANDHWEWIRVRKRKIDLEAVAREVGVTLPSPLDAMSAPMPGLR